MSLVRVPAVLVALVALALAPTSARAGVHVYAGWPARGSDSPFLVLEIGSRGLHVRQLVIHVEVGCRNGRLLVRKVIRPASVRRLAWSLREGRMAVRFSFRSNVGDGRWARVRATIAGRVRTMRASGRLSVSAAVTGVGDGGVEDRCAARRAWHAVRRPGRVFGGASDRNEPVALELSPDGRRARLHVAWTADCPDAPLWIAHDDFERRWFAVAGDGAFAASYEHPLGRARFRMVDLQGRVAGKHARGGLFLQQVWSGRNGFSCDSGRVRRSALTG